jgi:hypothetical protein
MRLRHDELDPLTRRGYVDLSGLQKRTLCMKLGSSARRATPALNR